MLDLLEQGSETHGRFCRLPGVTTSPKAAAGDSESDQYTLVASLEAERLAAAIAPFKGGQEDWIEAYVVASLSGEPPTRPENAIAAATTAWRVCGWAHPVVIARLDHQFGSAAEQSRQPSPLHSAFRSPSFQAGAARIPS